MGRNKILVICGPTAIGKTSLAFELAKKFDGILISADSRMVYKYMDIGTGKDSEKYGHVLGYDLVNPDEEFSVSQYLKFATNSIKNVIEEKKLPILVGGNGFYIKAVIDGVATHRIEPNKILRENLKDKTSQQMYKILENADPEKANQLNESDRQNPRRLIRAIETAGKIPEENFPDYDVLMIGLRLDKGDLAKRISDRVDERVKMGFEKEIDFLRRKGFWEGAPSMTIGYKDWPNIDKWKNEEIKYAKRQMTWFKKDKRVKWFDAGKESLTSETYEEVEKLTQKWYFNETSK